MIPCLAHLIHINRSPQIMAERLSSSKASAILLHVKAAATSYADAALWDRATLFGTGFRVHGGAAFGLTLNAAPLAGLGFWWDGWPDQLIETVTQEVEEGERLITLIAANCLEWEGEPLSTQLGSLTMTEDLFEVSYRRRIAYALGFHASLEQKSLQCYDSWYERLIRGTVDQLDGFDDLPEAWGRLSLGVNLLARLHGTVAYERAHDAPSPNAPGRVSSYDAKVALLTTRLARAVRAVARGLNADGRVALRGILHELRAAHRSGMWHVTEGPLWGRGPGRIYRSP